MSKVGDKAVQYLTSDRISSLPCNVINDILMRLPMLQAARTSILSKAWRQRWANIPQVVFDDAFARILQGVLQSTSHDRIMKTVYEVLLLHTGPIQKFVLSISTLKSCPEIDRLILFLSKKNIQDLNLQISSDGQSYHKLPSCLCSCLHLRCLKLRSCIFKPPPTFNGFRKLTTIHFWEVQFNADLFQKFISNCPLLEELTLDSCTAIDCLEFNAPNLKSLSLLGISNCFCFKNTPLLAQVSIYESSSAYPSSLRGKFSNFLEAFSCLPAVEVLLIDYYFLKTNLAIPDASMRLPATLNHLAIFNLCLAETDGIICTLCLLKGSPNLRKLKITVFDDQNASRNSCLQLLQSYGYMNFSLNLLQTVVLRCFTGTRLEVEFVKLLLAKSSALKMMHIKFSSRMIAIEQNKILKELIRLKRASVEAEIICKD